MIAENKQEFFEQLETELERLGVEDTDEVISDLRTHFDEGERSGKSEAEVCKELGNIREIARSCLDLKSNMINSIVAENEANKKRVSLKKPGREDGETVEEDAVRSYTPEHIKDEEIPNNSYQNAQSFPGAAQNAQSFAASGAVSSVNETVTASKSVSFAGCSDIEINANDVKTFVQPTSDNEIHIGVKIEDKHIALKAEQSGGKLDIDLKYALQLVGAGGKSFVMIELPQVVYNSLSLKSGSGELSAAGVMSDDLKLKLSSGAMNVELPQGFTAKNAELVTASGTLSAANVSADNYSIELKSGKCVVTGLTGGGKVSVASGTAMVLFASDSASPREFELASGRIGAYFPDSTKAQLRFKVASGSVKVDMGGVTASLSKSGEMPINLAAGENGPEMICQVKSGTVKLKNAEAFTEDCKSSDLGEAAVNFANALGNTVQNVVDKARAGLEKGLSKAADNLNSKSSKNDDVPFRPSDDFRKNGMKGGSGKSRRSDVPPTFKKADTKGEFRFVDISGMTPNIDSKKLIREILLDIFVRSWLVVLLFSLALSVFGAAVACIVGAFFCFFGMHGFNVFKLLTRILFGLGLLSFFSAIFCLGLAAMKGVGSYCVTIIKRHIEAIYDL